MRPGNVQYNLLPARKPDPEDPVGLGRDFSVLSESLAVTGGPDDWTVELSLTSVDTTITIVGIAGGFDLSAAYTGGAGITITALAIEVDLANNPGLEFMGAGAAGQLAVKLKEYGGILKDAAGLYLSLKAVADSSLDFDSGAITHVLQTATSGSGVVTAISGENLAWDASSGNFVFDPAGHFNPGTANTLIHTAPGVIATTIELPGTGVTLNFDANGHLVSYSES